MKKIVILLLLLIVSISSSTCYTRYEKTKHIILERGARDSIYYKIRLPRFYRVDTVYIDTINKIKHD